MFSIPIKATILFCATLLLLSTACRPASQTVTVFAASSLTNAFGELATAYEADNPGVDVQLNFASSSQLAAQLRAGVQGDVFASADPLQMQNAVDAERVTADAAQTFAHNRLTLVVPFDNPAEIRNFEDVTKPNVQLILAAEGVPIRAYTDEVLRRFSADFTQSVYANLVSEEDNVRVVVAKVALGEADAGIVYASDITPDVADKVQPIPIPDAQNVVATYLIAPLSDAQNPDLARQFVAFVLSEKGQAILTRWGLTQ